MRIRRALEQCDEKLQQPHILRRKLHRDKAAFYHNVLGHFALTHSLAPQQRRRALLPHYLRAEPVLIQHIGHTAQYLFLLLYFHIPISLLMEHGADSLPRRASLI